MTHNALSFAIEADMWAQPLPAAPLFAHRARSRDRRSAGRRSQRRALMNRRLLSYYNRELSYLRELGGEFARQFPKIAGRLGLDSFECADPYVERLLEGFAFLAARVQLKIDAEFRASPKTCSRWCTPTIWLPPLRWRSSSSSRTPGKGHSPAVFAYREARLFAAVPAK